MSKNLAIAALSLALAVSLLIHGMNLLGTKRPPEGPMASPSGQVGGNPETPPSDERGGAEAPAPPAPAQLPLVASLEAVFDGIEERPALEGAAIGFCLIGPGGEVLFEHHGHTAQIPASSLKTVTTATALELLGPGFTFETRLGTSSPGGDETGGRGQPTADLVLLGGGDPTLDPADLASWAEGLSEAGVRSIPGRIVGDGRHFAGSAFADFWNWGDIGNGYGSPVSGLNLGHNRFAAVLSPGEKEGDPVTLLGTFPDVPGVSWWNETKTAAEGSGDGVVVHGGERASVIHLRGTVPLGGELEVVGAIPDPERFAAYHLREALLEAGIRVEGEAVGAGELFLRGEPVPAIAEEILLHRSAPLLEIVQSIHETSDNHETECLYRTIGLRAGLAPDEAIREHWRMRGLELKGLRMVDGSGLARADHITPESLARLQHFAARGPAGEAYVQSLLELEEGGIRYKAGAMSSVRSYTGLVPTGEGNGEPLAFALIANHYSDVEAVRELQGAVFEALRPRPDPDEPPAAPASASPAP